MVLDVTREGKSSLITYCPITNFFFTLLSSQLTERKKYEKKELTGNGGVKRRHHSQMRVGKSTLICHLLLEL